MYLVKYTGTISSSVIFINIFYIRRKKFVETTRTALHSVWQQWIVSVLHKEHRKKQIRSDHF